MPPFLLALPWLLPYLAIPVLNRRRPRLAEAPPASGRLVSVIVPARNEAATIGRLIASLRRTAYAPVEFLVVDDRSTDATPAAVRAAIAGDGRFRLLPGEPLPAGWFGKSWACAQGARTARGDILVFTDADTVHAPELLGHAVGALTRDGAGLVTVISGQELVTFWERVVMPLVMVPLGVRYNPTRVNAATRPRDAIANGQFLMVTRAAYEAAGTHAAVRTEVAEDLVFGQLVCRTRLGLRMYWAEELVRTRMYTGFRQLAEGWSKNIHLGGQASFPDEPWLRRLAPLGGALAQLYWLAPLGAAALGAGWAAWAIALSAGFWVLVALGLRIPVGYGLTYPLGAMVLLWIVLRSAWRGSRRVEWRGRVYHDGSAANGAAGLVA